MTRIHAPLTLLREVMERQLMQGKLDEAAEIALRILPYDRPRLRPGKEPDVTVAATARREDSALKAAAKRLGLTKQLSTLMRKSTASLQPYNSAERSPIAVVEQAIAQHLLAGRLPAAAALATRLAPYSHARMRPVDPVSNEQKVFQSFTDEELDVFEQLLRAM